MAEHILVNFETIKNASSEVRRTAGTIKAQLEELKAGVTKISGSWEGAAQQGYQAHQAKWDQRAEHLQQVLESIAKSLDSAASSYQNTENRNATLWQG
ncbi:WXG100 family type VII secretion target [Kitasatospora purpeofusca]|uniref:WXG100 family type VII secretion target n=1 Tax=Kitasatospora purpeofusca TaxID=67352 RepID=UPI000B0E0D06|nr:WXG100 family type VII secretion target [Kitasatospora purpeofusca]MCX4757771.1 WXG100 family type VII secretion target [Kitasatospora purpeofusca]WSR34530.1 WXG100 family type VII secretion target [Kitasatospora purpeofusca]WSR42739.1 WXG100 family type VII secretion target [Kitasatospora purpeofusca]WTA51811.1 WXG100 family type VII secretion target [Kitasatospora purpeofusca]